MLPLWSPCLNPWFYYHCITCSQLISIKKNTICTRPRGLKIRTSHIRTLQIRLGYVFCWPLQFEFINNVVYLCYNTSWWTPTTRCICYYRPLGRLELVNYFKKHETMNDVKDNNVNLQIMFAPRCSYPLVSSSILLQSTI